MGVVSDGDCYGFPVGVVCSVPVRSEGGEWKVVQGIELTPAIQVYIVYSKTVITLNFSLPPSLPPSSLQSQLTLQKESLSQELELAWAQVQVHTST